MHCETLHKGALDGRQERAIQLWGISRARALVEIEQEVEEAPKALSRVQIFIVLLNSGLRDYRRNLQ